MNENSITRQLVKSLYSSLRRFVSRVNDEIGTGTEAPRPASNIIHDSRGWAYPANDVRERYEAECV